MNSSFSANCVSTTAHPLKSPMALRAEVALTADEINFVQKSRKTICDILSGRDTRLLVVVGPCSIHDAQAGYEYAESLQKLSLELSDSLFIVMRVYFEKPRTSDGWKGLIVDPHLTGITDIPTGLRQARHFLKRVTRLGLPAATEFLDPLTPLYISDCISWAAIGARTAESPTHRYLASGLPMPIGFKNNTAGCLKSAIFGMQAAKNPQSYLGINELGNAAAIRTTGNPYTHIVLRGGHLGPNYHPTQIAEATQLLAELGNRPRVMVDCSHGNSSKNHAYQPDVLRSAIDQIKNGSTSILGVMLESHLYSGSQPFPNDIENLKYGVSITDACIDFETTATILREAANALPKNPLPIASDMPLTLAKK